jgi:uncharacterized protein YbbK (DUF523 family)
MERKIAVVSRCLLGKRCRYDGVVKDYGIKRLLTKFMIIDVCPEMDIGLPAPREPIRLIKYKNQIVLIQRGTNLRLKRKIKKFSRDFLRSIKKVDLFVLKSRSPSCGNGDCKVFVDMFSDEICGYSDGIFKRECERIFPDVPIVNEENVYKVIEDDLT